MSAKARHSVPNSSAGAWKSSRPPRPNGRRPCCDAGWISMPPSRGAPIASSSPATPRHTARSDINGMRAWQT
jgi:hypothetical protein